MGNDRQGNNLVNFGKGNGSYCFACEYTIPSKGGKTASKSEFQVMLEKTSDKLISKEENEELKSKTGFTDYRGVPSAIWKKLGVRFAFDQTSADLLPLVQYYPTTMNYKLSGYKVRELPKSFGSSLGETGAVCDMFGQYSAKNGSKTILIVGGEIDCASAVYMIENYMKTKGYDIDNPFINVVSPTIGESCKKQVQANYKFFDQFDKIIIGLDNDEAGAKAAEKLIPALPKGKVFVAKWGMKDPNELLQAGKQKIFIDNVYSAKKFVPASILGSANIMDRVIAQAGQEKLSLPIFLHKVQKFLAGGISLGSIVNIISASGAGKTTFANELIYYWIFHSPYPVGIVTMELDIGQYGEVLLSRHIGQKLALIESKEDKLSLLNSSKVMSLSDQLFKNEDGSNRFYLLDDRDGSLDELKAVIEELIITCGCKVIVLDPLQDMLDGLDNESQAVFMKWQKSLNKSHGVIFININHTRKASNKQTSGSVGGDITEEDIQGSSTIYKSASLNFIFTRNKNAEDEIDRNTTKCKVSKNRTTGWTGHACDIYYEWKTHTLYDKDDYFSSKSSI
jgi:archaellum biogenesis ATPase FlaH